MSFGALSPLLLEWLQLRGTLLLKIAAALLYLGLYVYGRIILDESFLGSSVALQTILAEIGVATVGIAATILLCKVHALVGGIFLLSLALLHTANMEMVLALQTVIRFEVATYGVEETFLKGSALKPTFFWYGLSLIGVSALLAALWGNTPARHLGPPALLLVAALVLTISVTPFPLYGRSWSRGSLVWRSVTASLFDRSVPDPPTEVPELGPGEGAATGKLPTQSAPNVLLVVLEGMPGVYLAPVQEATGVDYPVTMERLSSIARESLVFPNAIAPNQQTVRGLYAILTGDYPHLDMSTPKAYGYIEKEPEERPTALPRVLSGAGYRTLFLQGAYLGYMAKGRIMEAMGFETILGRSYFQRSYASSGWGPDDRAFFEGAVELLQELQGEDKPWFLTLLNVGTHHPYVLPEGFASDFDTQKLASVEYLDQALGWFYNALGAQGLLEDTLLLFVSDESHGVSGQPFGQYWPVLMVQGPGIEAGIRGRRVSQVDVSWTILSHLGIAESSGMIPRQNILVRYSQPREEEFFFGPFISPEPGLILEQFRGGQIREYQSDRVLYAPTYREEIRRRVTVH
jgi:hypothetical protein